METEKMESVKVAIRINGKYANEKTVRQINDRMAEADRRKHVWETHETYVQRKAREYVKQHNLTHETQTVNCMGAEKKQRHYSKRVLHTWEKNDTQRKSDTHTEICVLYENGTVLIRKAYVTRAYVTRTTDNIITHTNEIVVTLPRINVKIKCSVLKDMSEIPETIELDGEKYDRDTLLKAILETNKVIYRMEEIL